MIELRFNKYIFSDLIFAASYRYYNQSQAYFYQQRYVGDDYLTTEFRTDDYKLKSFTSNKYGLTLQYLLRGLIKGDSDLEFLRNSSIELMFFRYVNDLQFSANILQGNIKFSI